MEMNQKRITIDKKDGIYLLLFAISLINGVVCTAFFVLLLLYSINEIEKGLKSLILISTREILSPVIASSTGNAVIKMGVILLISILILIRSKGKTGNRMKNLLLPIITFLFYLVLSTFITSDYPITSLFKIISFGIPFLAVLIGVSATSNEYKWADYLTVLFTVLMIASVITIPFNSFRIINSDFQGVFNHVNMFGIIGALYVPLLLYSSVFDRKEGLRNLILIATLIMVFLSKSRTGMFSAVAVIICYLILYNKKKSPGLVLLVVFIVIAALVSLLLNGPIASMLSNFIYKGNTDDLLASRMKQIYIAQQKFESNKILGSGFMVPQNPQGTISYTLSFGLVVEPGNIIWALAGDTGIIGIILFSVMLIQMIMIGGWRKLFLFLSVLLVNMGEMVLFSSNNMAMLCYMLLGIYMFDNNVLAKGDQNQNESQLYYSRF